MQNHLKDKQHYYVQFGSDQTQAAQCTHMLVRVVNSLRSQDDSASLMFMWKHMIFEHQMKQNKLNVLCCA